MAAARLNIELEEKSNLTFDFTYLDEDGDAVDVSNYGGTIAFAKDEKSEAFAKGTVVDGWLEMGGSNGQIVVNVPYTAFSNLNLKRGIWQLYIYPTQGDPTDRPKRLIEGEWVYKPSII